MFVAGKLVVTSVFEGRTYNFSVAEIRRKMLSGGGSEKLVQYCADVLTANIDPYCDHGDNIIQLEDHNFATSISEIQVDVQAKLIGQLIDREKALKILVAKLSGMNSNIEASDEAIEQMIIDAQNTCI